MKHYKIKKTPELIRKVKKFYPIYSMEETRFYDKVRIIEREMAKVTGIKDIEFVWFDNQIVGIGNHSRTMPLIQREEL